MIDDYLSVSNIKNRGIFNYKKINNMIQKTEKGVGTYLIVFFR